MMAPVSCMLEIFMHSERYSLGSMSVSSSSSLPCSVLIIVCHVWNLKQGPQLLGFQRCPQGLTPPHHVGMKRHIGCSTADLRAALLCGVHHHVHPRRWLRAPLKVAADAVPEGQQRTKSIGSSGLATSRHKFAAPFQDLFNVLVQLLICCCMPGDPM